MREVLGLLPDSPRQQNSESVRLPLHPFDAPDLNSSSKLWARAASEFVVIVIGVLVALTVDQWVNEQQARTSELRYLASLEEEFRRDSAVFVDILIPRLQAAAAGLEEVRPVARGLDPFPADTLGFLRTLQASAFAISSFPQEGLSFEAALASGEIQLIKSQLLRSAVIDYYAQKRLTETLVREDDSGFRHLVGGYLPAPPDGERITDRMIREFGVRPAAEAVATAEFLVAMNRHTSYIRRSIPRLEPMPRRLGVLLEQVHAELMRLR